MLYVGGVLFANAMMLPGKAEPRSVGIFNLFVGVLQVVVPFYIIVTAEETKLTIYTGDSLRYGRKKLYYALIEMLHDEGIAGATVLHGIEGYGADKRIHVARILDLSADLPVVVVAIDRTEKIEAVLPKLDARVEKGLVTTESVRVILSRPSP